MRTRTGFAAGVVLMLALGGCTIRYSQSLAGRLPPAKGTPVQSSDSGFSLLQITFSEPTPAHEQVISLLGACQALTNVEVDYRELYFLLFGIPKVSVHGVCEP